MVELSDVYCFFPELNEISDEELRNKAACMWRKAINENGWTEDTIRRSPIVNENPTHPGNNLEHIRDVANLSLRIYDYLRGKYGEKIIFVSRDMVLASAICHDVGKMYEYRVTEEGPGYSEDAHYLRHPLKGAILASEFGMPREVIHAIGTHSWEGNNSWRSLISFIVRAADDLAYKSLCFCQSDEIKK